MYVYDISVVKCIYPRPPCAPSFVKSRMLCPLQTHFLLFQQIFVVLVCIHPGNARVPSRVLVSERNPAGAMTRFLLIQHTNVKLLWKKGRRAVKSREFETAKQSLLTLRHNVNTPCCMLPVWLTEYRAAYLHLIESQTCLLCYASFFKRF